MGFESLITKIKIKLGIQIFELFAFRLVIS